MIEKFKSLFLDYSDSFKEKFLFTLKKSIIFLIVGLILFCINNDVTKLIGAICIIIFGLFWASGLTKTLLDISSGYMIFGSNSLIKFFITILIFIVCMALGYLYFAWGIIKLIIMKGGKVMINRESKSEEQQ